MGRGYATEAVRALIEALFALTKAKRIVASARTKNPASRRVLEKSGFAYIDSGLDLLPARGGLHPCDRFQLSRKRWAASRAQLRPAGDGASGAQSMATALALMPQSQGLKEKRKRFSARIPL